MSGYRLEMIAWTSCLMCGALFMIRAVMFTFLKGKAAAMVGGFNSLPSEAIEKYKERMCRRMRNTYLFLGIVFITGGALSYFYGVYFTVLAYIIVIAYAVHMNRFFRELKTDADRAFSKYRI